MSSDPFRGSRRRFLQTAAAISGAVAVGRSAPATNGPSELLPTIDFGPHKLTKMLIGSNPFYGYSHFNGQLDNFMREYFTQDRRVALLHKAEAAGINTWQCHYNDAPVEDYKRYRAEGGKMNFLLLSDFELFKNWKLLPDVVKVMNPIGIAHHGNRTDERFRAGQMNLVEDFTKAVHDAGVPAGVSCHNPEVVAYIEDHDWKLDYYMTCLYRVSRTPEETRKAFNEAPLGETFMERDPERMTAMVRKTKRTCFAFKLLGAGRNISKPETIEAAFRFALTNIKPQDGVIVGMVGKFKDEVTENVSIVRKIMAEQRAT